MIISKTPLRISFCGGGTDIKNFWSTEQGKVLASAIDKYIYVIIKSRFDDDIVLNYTKREVVSNVLDLKHDLVREALKKTGVRSGVEIWTPSDIPSKGSGLGSSSTLTVGLLNAFYTFKSVQVEAENLAREACEIEIDILGKPIGKQDQYIAAYGGMHEISFNSDDVVSLNPIDANNRRKKILESNILLLFTGITRESKDILRDQKNKMPKNRATLRKMKSQVLELKKLLESNQKLDDVGRILNDAWNYKRELSRSITNTQIEQMYRKALLSGALGGKICGAGGGGFLMIYVTKDEKEMFRKSMGNYQELEFEFSSSGSNIIFNDGNN